MASPERTSRRRARRANDNDTDDEVADRRVPRIFALRAWGWSHRDVVGCVIGLSATIIILVNVLFLQSGPHPAPMVKSSLLRVALTGTNDRTAGALPRPRPVAAVAPTKTDPPPTRPAVEIISEIQRELTRRGFYDGAVDGQYGPKTDAAIRDFEHATGLKPSAEPSDVLLRAIKTSPSNSAKTTGSTARRAQPVRNDPIAEILAPSKRVLAVQRALAEFGYAQIRPTGVLDPETQAAIERFERKRKLPITGNVSDRVTRELAAITGRPLE
jgi:peptidoglycan hydrolase-like protein with peptidoglycan-binding domain